MDKKEAEFIKRLLTTFMMEAEEHLHAISTGLIALEKGLAKDEEHSAIETVFRASHSLKGAARAVNILEIERICQCLEDCFQAWKNSGISRQPGLFDALHATIEGMRSFLASYDAGAPEKNKTFLAGIISNLSRFDLSEKDDAARKTKKAGLTFKPARPPEPATDAFANTPKEQPAKPAAPEPSMPTRERPSTPATVRIASSKLAKILLETEELLTARLASARQTAQLMDTAGMMDAMRLEFAGISQSVMPSIKRDGMGRIQTSESARLGEFLDRAQTNLRALDARFKGLVKAARHNQKSLERMTGALLDDMKDVMMLPFGTLLEGFPMLARNLAQEQGKLIDMEIRGESLEIDRRILEEIKAPLTHIIRNSVDHGIETPEKRRSINKPERGRISISITHAEGSRAEIVISDDGAGIDLAGVKDAAVKSGAVDRDEARRMDHDSALPFIFHSGVSTSPMITDISGRGLGLAIVREKIEKIGGSVSAESALNAGTVFKITLPLTLATFRGIVVRTSDAVFIVPTARMIKTLRVKDEDIHTAGNKDVITFNGRPVSFIRLEHALSLPVKAGKKTAGQAHYTQVMILESADKRIAFGVDEVLGEREVLVKPLGPQLARVPNVAGAAILGAGKPVPVLNVTDLLVSAVKAGPSERRTLSPKEEARKLRILVAEDSITSRILLKNILEGAGYEVKTAVDGIDALTALKTEDFDLVVSDVEMPRMHGFDLTANIRSDKKLAELPVILVTALDSRHDRERGISVGANAYIVKSSFNQGNLLEVIKRLA